MAYKSVFNFAPAEWLPIRNQALLEELVTESVADHQG